MADRRSVLKGAGAALAAGAFGWPHWALAQALKYDYFIDDRPKNCLAVQAASPNTKIYLNYASHNWDFDAEKHGMTRVANVNEFAKIVLSEA